MNDNLDSRYSYTFPLLISTSNNITSETNFIANIRERDVSFGEVEKIAKLLEEEKEKMYSGNVVLECKIGKDEFYEYEDVEVHCDAKNTGNVFLEDADVCFEGKCQKISLGISQAKNATFEVNNSIIGQRQSAVTLRNELVSKSSYIDFKVNDAPKIEIEKLEFPINVSYEQNFTVSFTLAKSSGSNPKNIEVVFAQNGIRKEWGINELAENRRFVLDFIGSQLKYGKNDYRIYINYYDGLNKQYNANKEFSISLVNASLWQRLLLFFNSFEKISLQSVTIMLLVVAVVFIGLFAWIWRKSKGY